MTWICIAIATICAVEIFLRGSFVTGVSEVFRAYFKSIQTIRSERLSETIKQQLLIASAVKIFRQTVGLGLGLAFVTLPFITIVLGGYWLNINTYEILISVPGILFSVAILGLYLPVRRKIFDRL